MIEHIVGPPGTGKTEQLMTRVEEHLARGISPDEIGYISFTKAAVNEARQRAAEKFQLSRNDLPLFGTIHSLCYRALGLDRGQVFSTKHWRELAEALNLQYAAEPKDSDVNSFEPFETYGAQEGDVLRSWYDWTRNSDLPLEDAVRDFDPPLHVDWSPGRATWFAREYEAYKRQHDLLDFCDMLLLTRRKDWRPRARALVLDEAQDLSPLQRSLFTTWSQGTPTVHMGYDEDQAVYGFQGADPGWLMEFPGERRFLKRSHRVPAKPARLAQRLISRNKRRYAKEWAPRAESGDVQFDVHLDALLDQIAQPAKTWYLLARNNFYLSTYSDTLQREGIPYTHLRGYSPLAKVPGAVVAALRLAAGLDVSWDEVRLLAQDTPAKPYWEYGAKAEIQRVAREKREEPLTLGQLHRLGAQPVLVGLLGNPATCLRPIKKPQATKQYYQNVVARYGIEGLTRKPHVVLGSCHSVKGGQADNVAVLPDMTRRTFEGYEDGPEQERRVWYVALTRCIDRLYILEPTQRQFFDEW